MNSRRPHLLARFRVLDFSIAARLNVGFTIVLLLLAAIGGLGWWQAEASSHRTAELVDVDAKSASHANNMQIAVQEIVIALGESRQYEDEGEIKRAKAEFRAAADRYAAAKTAFPKTANASTHAEWRKNFESVKAAEDSAVTLFDQMNSLAGVTGREVVANYYAAQVSEPLGKWMESLGLLRKAMASAMEMASASSARDARAAQWLMAAIVRLAIAGGVDSSILISRSICRPLIGAIQVAKAVALGNLSVDVPTHRRDEIGTLMTALADMQEGPRRLVGSIRQSAENIQLASSEAATGNTDLCALK